MNILFDQVKAESLNMSINSFKMELSDPPTTEELLIRAEKFYDFMTEVSKEDNVATLSTVQ